MAMSELSEYDDNHALSARFVLSAPLGFLVGLLCTKLRSFNDAPTSSPPPIEVRPSPSHVDAHGSSPVLTFTPSPSPDVASMPIDEDVPNLAMEDPFLTSMIVLWLHLSMERFVGLRLRQRLSHCPLGNNLITHGLHEEQFQKIIKNFFPSIFSVRDVFMVLEILLILINVEMTTSCSVHKDLPVTLKIQRRLTD
ncbi:hypothetical protein JHK82_015724 [Glycine max]|nr:hypothetical protein JHK82_015724 [Glycine max]